MNEIIRLAWGRFSTITGVIGDIQGRVVVTLFYYSFFIPFGLASRFLSDPLHMRGENARPQWLDRHPVGATLEEAQEQG